MSEPHRVIPVSHALESDAALVIERVLAGTAYLEGALEAFRAAVAHPSEDARALASVSGEQLDGVAVLGIFGGTVGAGRLHFVVVDQSARRLGAGARLMDAGVSLLRASDARFVLAELPEDPDALPGAREFLQTCGFSLESRVGDFLRDGVGISFMRRELARD